MPQPISMVQRSGPGKEKRWFVMLLHGFPQTQCVYKEGFLPSAVDPGGTGEYGRHCTFLHDGFQKQILASQDGTKVSTVHRFHHGQSGVLQVYLCALWALQCSCNFPMPHAKHLGELNLTYCIIYLDDVIVFGHSEEEHLEHLCIVFNLKLKPSKCSFFQSKIVYLAHHVSCEGIHPSRENVHAIEEFPMLETFTYICAFCGLAGHYWHFIKGFAHIARPLYNVLGNKAKMGTIQLPTEVQEAVRILKDKIQSAPVLVFPDFDKPSLLETEASKEGLGAMLSQKQDDRCYHPVTFGSCSLMPAEKNYYSLKLEFLTLKWGVMQHFKEYLAHAPFVVRTDNNPLTYILTTPTLKPLGTDGLARWPHLSLPWNTRKGQTMEQLMPSAESQSTTTTRQSAPCLKVPL